jgi:MinD-like ATPase involved in chromosome partitioning or flagellar assembly
VNDPYVVLGLARTRQVWFSDLSRWSTSGSAPIEFLKCLTAEEARAVLGSGRRLSALLVDSGTPGLDRDLIAAAGAAGAPTIVVTDGRVHRDWDSIGCAALLSPGFDCGELTATLERHARPVERSTRRAARITLDAEPARSHVVGVTGAGGSGSSTVAMCVAQSLAAGRPDGSVALVDGSRNGDLAMYHDIGDVIPGLPELVEAHRVDHPDPDDVRSLLFRIDERGYDLLLGLRAPRDWVAMRPHSLRAAFEGLERSYDLVVVDHDPDLEGEEETGSVGVEDRHGIARTVACRADLVLAVGEGDLKGANGLIRLVLNLREHGVPAERIVPVINRSRRSPVHRAEVTRALAELTSSGTAHGSPPIFLQASRGLERTHRTSIRLPEPLCRRLGRTAQRRLLELGNRVREPERGAPIRPGELGTDLDVGSHRFGTSPSDRSDVA